MGWAYRRTVKRNECSVARQSYRFRIKSTWDTCVQQIRAKSIPLYLLIKDVRVPWIGFFQHFFRSIYPPTKIYTTGKVKKEFRKRRALSLSDLPDMIAATVSSSSQPICIARDRVWNYVCSLLKNQIGSQYYSMAAGYKGYEQGLAHIPSCSYTERISRRRPWQLERARHPRTCTPPWQES
jgi:hypothetical protein